MDGTTLVFPSSMIAALDFAQKAKQSGARVLAASSNRNDETAHHFDHWMYLPSVYDTSFVEHFLEAVSSRGVTRFFTAHPLVYNIVKRIADQHALSIEIADCSPIKTLNNSYRALLLRAGELHAFASTIDSASTCSLLDMASLLHHAGQIYGQSSETKITAMSAIFASAPKGDVVEIGSAWGRSAFALHFLARRYGIGHVLCIDPWDVDIAIQKESSGQLESVNRELDWELMFTIFRVNLLNCRDGRFNYVKATSKAAEAKYITQTLFKSDEFGETSYAKTIAVLHIDGNHDYENVRCDYTLWRRHIAPGGWLILDDYVWEHGGGPRRLGNEILAEEAASIDHCFTAGNALFIPFT